MRNNRNDHLKGGRRLAAFCGTDIISVERIENSIQEFGDTFIKRIYTDEEIQYCESRRMSKYQSYAARFAAKEAVYKALSTNKEGVAHDMEKVVWHDVEVINLPNGKPIINFHGQLLDTISKMKIEKENIDLSLSHDASYAIATVVMVKK